MYVLVFVASDHPLFQLNHLKELQELTEHFTTFNTDSKIDRVMYVRML